MYCHRFKSFMGSDSPMFLSEIQLHDPIDMDNNLVYTSPTQLLGNNISQNFDDQQIEEKKHDDHHQESLKIKLPAATANHEEKEEEDGCKTPTSKENKIPPMVCPPAPKKPKCLLPATRRKVSRRRVFLDMSKEIEALFPPTLLADLGNKIKKVRKDSLII